VLDFAHHRPLACTLRAAWLVFQARLTAKLPLLWAALALLCVCAALLPRPYVATARVLLPPQLAAPGASRVHELRHLAMDSRAAQAKLGEALRALPGAALIDDARVQPLAGSAAWLLMPGLLFGWLFARARGRARARVPERAQIREAVMLAQRGHLTVLVDNGERFRVLLADNAPDRGELPVLARLAGGARVLARRA
jgi:hypothetical protein